MSDQEDILQRLRSFRNRREAAPGYLPIDGEDRAMLSEAVAEIVELRGRALRAERRAEGYRHEMERQLNVKVVQSSTPTPTPETARSPAPKVQRGRAIRVSKV